MYIVFPRVTKLHLPSGASFQNINQVINRGIAADGNVGRVDFVFTHDGLDFVVTNVRQRHCARNVETTLVLLLEGNVWRRLVDADAETFQFGLDNTFVSQRLVDVQNDEDQMAGLGDGNDLTTSTTTVLGTFNNTG